MPGHHGDRDRRADGVPHRVRLPRPDASARTPAGRCAARTRRGTPRRPPRRRPVDRLGVERHLVRAQHHVDVDVARRAQPGTVDTTPISQVSSASWTWAGRKSASPMNDATKRVAGASNTATAACPPARSAPPCITTTRSPTDSASVWSWVTSIAVVPVSRSTADRLGADLGAERLVEAAERLVEEHDGRPRARAPGPAPPAAARRRTARGGSGRPGGPSRTSVEHLADPGGALGSRGSRSMQPNATLRVTVRCGNSAWSWKTSPTRRRSGLHRRPRPGDLLAGDQDPAGVGPLEAGDQPQRGRLPAAGRADQRHQLAGVHATGRGRARPARAPYDFETPSSTRAGAAVTSAAPTPAAAAHLRVRGAHLPEQEEHRHHGERDDHQRRQRGLLPQFSFASW